jgi:hypothetical protein
MGGRHLVIVRSVAEARQELAKGAQNIEMQC